MRQDMLTVLKAKQLVMKLSSCRIMQSFRSSCLEALGIEEHTQVLVIRLRECPLHIEFNFQNGLHSFFRDITMVYFITDVPYSCLGLLPCALALLAETFT